MFLIAGPRPLRTIADDVANACHHAGAEPAIRSNDNTQEQARARPALHRGGAK
jgi:hypothetical protein